MKSRWFRPRPVGLVAVALGVAVCLHSSVARAGKPSAPVNANQNAVVPPYAADEEVKTFKLPPGLKIEVVAAEPLCEHPVHAAFGADGRLWVVEMRGYMQDVKDKKSLSEKEATGRVSVLTDTDGDGKFDKKTVFLDGLVMPRAVGFAGDGVLVVAPPNLLFCRDTKGQGVCTEKTVIAKDLGEGNPEYKVNGLLRALDNWIYNANYTYRWKYDRGGKFINEGTLSRGQWGISQDDYGRLFFNSNSSLLHADLVPASYLSRNSNFSGSGLNATVHTDGKVFLSHHTITNRGSENKLLDSVTAACGPHIFRSDLLGAEFNGNAFICEPVGNLVKRNVLNETDGVIKGKSPYDKFDFLTSTDERFRPVNILTGPEGALYIVDMHHGLIQHRGFLTEYAQNGYITRGLEKHLGMGRILRVVPDNSKPLPPAPNIAKLEGKALVAMLGDANGWRRDTAQRILVDRRDSDDLDDIREFARKSTSPLGKIHALWTLEGLNSADVQSIAACLKDANARVRAAAIRVSESLLANPMTRVAALAAIKPFVNDKPHEVRLQICFTLSELGTPETDAALLDILAAAPNDNLLRDAVLSGLRGRELPFLERLLAKPEWKKSLNGRGNLLTALSGCVFAQRNGKDVQKLITLVAAVPATDAWQKEALLEGPTQAANSKAKLLRKPVRVAEEPTELVKMSKDSDNKIKSKASAALNWVVWTGKPGYSPPPPPPVLTAAQLELYEHGRKIYSETCAKCHQPDGLGRDGLAPSLIDSEWVVGSDKRLARGLLAGIQGPIKIDGKTISLEMPALKTLSDRDLAGAMTFIRRTWDHEAAPVDPSTVAKLRPEAEKRGQPYNANDLLKLTN